MTDNDYAQLVAEGGIEVFRALCMDGQVRSVTMLLPLPIDMSPEAAIDIAHPNLNTITVSVPCRQALLAHEGRTFRAILADLVHVAISEAGLWPPGMSTWDMEQFPEDWRPPPEQVSADYLIDGIIVDDPAADLALSPDEAERLQDQMDVQAQAFFYGAAASNTDPQRLTNQSIRAALRDVIEASGSPGIADQLHRAIGELTRRGLSEAQIAQLEARLEITNQAGADEFARAIGAEVLRQAAASDRETQAIWDDGVARVNIPLAAAGRTSGQTVQRGPGVADLQDARAVEELFPGNPHRRIRADADLVAEATARADTQGHDLEDPPLPRTEAARLSWDEWVKQSADLLEECRAEEDVPF